MAEDGFTFDDRSRIPLRAPTVYMRGMAMVIRTFKMAVAVHFLGEGRSHSCLGDGCSSS